MTYLTYIEFVPSSSPSKLYQLKTGVNIIFSTIYIYFLFSKYHFWSITVVYFRFPLEMILPTPIIEGFILFSMTFYDFPSLVLAESIGLLD